MLFNKKKADEAEVLTEDASTEDGTAADVEAMMKKFDLESNTRVWEGKPKLVVMSISALFAVYCIWSTLFSKAGIEIRLTAFLAAIIVIGYLNYPRSKHHVHVNTLPWYDVVLMVAGDLLKLVIHKMKLLNICSKT